MRVETNPVCTVFYGGGGFAWCLGYAAVVYSSSGFFPPLSRFLGRFTNYFSAFFLSQQDETRAPSCRLQKELKKYD